MYRTYFFATILLVYYNLIEGCEIDLDEKSGKHPPFFLNDAGHPIYPINNRKLSFGEGAKVTLFCHGTDKKPNKVKSSSLGLDLDKTSKSIDLECKSDGFYYQDQKVTDMNKATCSRVMEPEIIKEEQSDCSKGFGADGESDALDISLVKVGWNFNGNFEEQLRACIDENVYGTLWTKHQVHGESIAVRDKFKGRPSFRTDTRGYKRFFDFTTSTSVTRAYRKTNQVSAIKKLLDTNNKLEDGTKIIESSRSGTNYFARGHLAPDASFIDEAEQDATYFFFNVAPQFQSFNNGNWKALEYVTREMAENHNGTVTVYTGTYDILQYPDKNKNMQSIYLMEKDNKWYIPAPKYYWKLLLNEVTKEAVAFVGLNDPHADDIPPEQAFCQTSCGSIKGVDWDTEEESKGHMSCCTLQELKEKVPFVPEIIGDYADDTDLLDGGGTGGPGPGGDGDTCQIDLEERKGKHPPFVLRNSDELVYPEGSRILKFDVDETATLFCHGTDKRANFIDMETLGLTQSPLNNNKVELLCNQNKEFEVDGKVISVDRLNDVACTRIMEPLIEREEGSDCSSGLGADGRTDDLGTIILAKIGWDFGNGFEEQFSTCIDEKVSGTLWTLHTVFGKNIEYQDKESGRPSFRVDTRGYKRFFTFATATAISDSYTKKSQIEVINTLLGGNTLPNGDPIIDDSSSGTNYFSRGHISPDAAFIEGAEQDATYFFFNVAPQFQSFNNGNWVALEKATRILAAESNGNIKVWSGTYGVLNYPDQNGNEVAIYLYLDGDKKHIPAPKFFWKVLKDETKNQAVAFIGLNDPHADDISPEEAFCTSICNQINGVDWDVELEEKGHMACCTVQDLYKKIPFAPDLGDIDLLTVLEL